MSLRIGFGKTRVFTPARPSTSAEDDVKEEPPDDYAYQSTSSYRKEVTSVRDSLTCKNCGVICQSHYLLKIHEKQVCRERPIGGDIRRSILIASGVFHCTNCGRICKTQRNLELHELHCLAQDYRAPISPIGSSDTMGCSKCGTPYKDRYSLIRHEAVCLTAKERKERGISPYTLSPPPLKVVKPLIPRKPTAVGNLPRLQLKRQLKYKCYICCEVMNSLNERAEHVEKVHPSNVAPKPPPLQRAARLLPNPSPKMLSVLAEAGFALAESEDPPPSDVSEGVVDCSAQPSVEAGTSSEPGEDSPKSKIPEIEVKEEVEDTVETLPGLDKEVFFPCGLCLEIFSTDDERNLHEQDHFGTRDLDILFVRRHMYRCTLCSQVFPMKKEAEYHILAHALNRRTTVCYANVIAALAIHNTPISDLSLQQICTFSSKYFTSLHHNRFQFHEALEDILKDKTMFTTSFVIKANHNGDLGQQAVFGFNEEWREKRLPGLLEAFEREPNKWLELPAMWSIMKTGKLNWLR